MDCSEPPVRGMRRCQKHLKANHGGKPKPREEEVAERPILRTMPVGHLFQRKCRACGETWTCDIHQTPYVACGGNPSRHVRTPVGAAVPDALPDPVPIALEV